MRRLLLVATGVLKQVPFFDSTKTNDSAAVTNSAAAESSPAHQEAWAIMKDYVLNKFESKVVPPVIIGDAAWGDVNVSMASKNVLEGTLEGAFTNIHQTGGKEFFGKTPWGETHLAFKDGRLAGAGSWGEVSVKVTDKELNGDIPWGKVHLSLKGQNLTGDTPWGIAHLRLGDKYHSLTNPDVLMGLTAILSDR